MTQVSKNNLILLVTTYNQKYLFKYHNKCTSVSFMVFVRYPLKKENVEKQSFAYYLVKNIVYKAYLYIVSIDLPTFVFTHKYNTI